MSDLGTGAVVFVIVGIVCYLIPTIVAMLRSHKDLPAIAAIDILFGWTVAGWFVAFIWSLADPSGRGRGTQTVVINTTQSNAALAGPGAAPPVYAPIPPPGPAARQPADLDTAFWDALRDKSDPDSLEEYVLRFPHGQFAALARGRLERHGRAAEPPAPPTSLPPPPAVQLAAYCTECGAALAAQAGFCTECGASAASVAVA